MSATESTPKRFVWPQIDEAHARLHQLEKQDRSRWLIVSTIMVSLAAAVFDLSLPGVTASLFSNRLLTLAVRSFLLLIPIYTLICLQKQRATARTRRELASELAIIAAAETLKLTAGKPREGDERRKFFRVPSDERVKISIPDSTGSQEMFGRIVDICEHGVGAIIPGELSFGQQVLLQFFLVPESSKPLKVVAIVRQRTGFRYGMNFLYLSEADREQIERLRSETASNNVVSISVKGASGN